MPEGDVETFHQDGKWNHRVEGQLIFGWWRRHGGRVVLGAGAACLVAAAFLTVVTAP